MILAFQCFIIAWLLAEFEPLQEQWDKLFKKAPQTALFDYLYIAVGCHRCLALWITLAVTWNPFLAIGASMAAQVWTKLFKD